MKRIGETFQRLQARDEKALVGFVTAGDPTPLASMAIIHAMIRGGVDILELGVPFSDPTADGPTIQRASARALKAGTNLATVLGMTREIRERASLPIVLFTYYNPVLAYGLGRFCRDALQAGTDGLLVVDLPPEEAGELASHCPNGDLALIRLVAPTTPPSRMAGIARGASGFLYVVSMTGVTGSGGMRVEEVSRTIQSLRNVTALPICVGFGISTAEQVAAVASVADGVVVGSAFERLIEAHLEDPMCAQIVDERVRLLKEATRGPFPAAWGPAAKGDQP